MKKITSILLCLILILSFNCISAFAADIDTPAGPEIPEELTMIGQGACSLSASRPSNTAYFQVTDSANNPHFCAYLGGSTGVTVSCTIYNPSGTALCTIYGIKPNGISYEVQYSGSISPGTYYAIFSKTSGSYGNVSRTAYITAYK